MKANERNKKMYETLLLFSGDILSSKETGQFDVDTFVLFGRLLESEYLRPVAGKDNTEATLYDITPKGWEYLTIYERYVERKRTNQILTILTIFAAAYYFIEILKFFFAIKSPIFGGQSCY
jgi:hypothetical protein